MEAQPCTDTKGEEKKSMSELIKMHISGIFWGEYIVHVKEGTMCCPCMNQTGGEEFLGLKGEHFFFFSCVYKTLKGTPTRPSSMYMVLSSSSPARLR
jgi:hypothetical protein